jgi:hypothetical protein
MREVKAEDGKGERTRVAIEGYTKTKTAKFDMPSKQKNRK